MKEKSDNTTQITPKKNKSSAGPLLVTAIFAAVLGAGGAVWYVQNSHNNLLEQYEVKLGRIADQSNKNQQTASNALTKVQNQTQQIQQLSQDLSKSQAQLADISLALQTITDSGSDLILLNDVEQLVILAQQQLMIGGNIANAIVSLETAQSRLAHANRQNLASLMQTVNGDLDRLRAVQVIDVATITAQLDRLKELLDQAPLYVPDSKNSSINGQVSSEDAPPAPEVVEKEVLSTANSTEEPWWQRTLDQTIDFSQKSWQTISQDLGQFVSVRRIDDKAALLMSSDQADRFRESLQLRVTMAQLALMTKQTKVWDAEMAYIISAIEQRFDPSVALTQRALSLATKLSDTAIDTPLPSLDNSLAAIEGLKQADQQPLNTPTDLDTNEPKEALQESNT